MKEWGNSVGVGWWWRSLWQCDALVHLSALSSPSSSQVTPIRLWTTLYISSSFWFSRCFSKVASPRFVSMAVTLACSHFGSIVLLCAAPSPGPPYPSSEWGSRRWRSIPWGNAPVTHKLSASGTEGSPSGSYSRSLTVHWPSLHPLWCGLSSWGFKRWLFPDYRMRLPCPGRCCSIGRSSWGSTPRASVTMLHFFALNAFPRSHSSSAMRPGLSASVSSLQLYGWHGRSDHHLQTDNTWFQDQGHMTGRWKKK